MPSGLRFDRVAQEFIARLQKAIGDLVPADRTLVLTVTAPIRQDSKTRVEFEQAIRGFLARPGSGKGIAMSLYTNRVEARLIGRQAQNAARVVGYVHNKDVKPALLFEAARVALSRS